LFVPFSPTACEDGKRHDLSGGVSKGGGGHGFLIAAGGFPRSGRRPCEERAGQGPTLPPGRGFGGRCKRGRLKRNGLAVTCEERAVAESPGRFRRGCGRFPPGLHHAWLCDAVPEHAVIENPIPLSPCSGFTSHNQVGLCGPGGIVPAPRGVRATRVPHRGVGRGRCCRPRQAAGVTTRGLGTRGICR